ncbi:MAG: acetyl-CoA hydrolase/transferase C-terminal domain-containing protein [Pseudomonadota bacterium]
MKLSSVEDALAALRDRFPGPARVYVAGCSGEPLAVADAVRASPDLAGDLTFLGVWIPGVNRTDWAGLHQSARAESIFVSPDLRSSFETGRTAFRPLAYTQAWPWLRTTPLDAAFIMTTTPDAEGKVSLGVSADFAGAIFPRSDVFKIALVNRAMPRPKDSPTWALGSFDGFVEGDWPLLSTPSVDLAPAFGLLAANIAGLIEAGDTLQFGLGNVQQATLRALTDHRGLKIHSGMVSDPVLELLDAGAVVDAPGAVTTGVAIGTAPLYARAAEDPRFSFRPVSYTHALANLASIPAFKAVNSVIEVDLFGQANAEFLNGRQISGAGGLVDFLRGGQAATGGLGVAALVSTAKRGEVSRIVPRLPADATTISRADMDVVATEHGVAELRGRSVDERAEALIAIAAPDHRDRLSNAWDEMRRAM